MLDLERMALRIFRPQRRLVIAMFINGGFNEISFVRNAGAVIGMTFGMVQLVIYTSYRAGWVLPVFGGCIGAFTNWLALQLIFRPIYPVNLGCCVLQGLFLKRQKQVSAIAAWLPLAPSAMLRYAMLLLRYARSPPSSRAASTRPPPTPSR